MGQVLDWGSSMQKVKLFHGFLVFALFLGHFSSQFKNITVKPKNKYDSNYLFVKQSDSRGITIGTAIGSRALEIAQYFCAAVQTV
jgi:hypothetical protein